MEQVKKEYIGSRVWVRSLQHNMTITEASTSILKSNGMDLYIENPKAEQRENLSSLSLIKLRKLYPEFEDLTKAEILEKLNVED
jgi:hypothetical protein